MVGMKKAWGATLLIVLCFSICLSVTYIVCDIEKNSSSESFFFGVSFSGNTSSEAKTLIDKVKGYTNLFVINNWDVAMNETILNEICDYAVHANLNIIVFFSFVFFNSTQLSQSAIELFKSAKVEPFHVRWLSTASERFGEKFLGAWVNDEPGGKQIDIGSYTGFKTGMSGRPITTFVNVSDYSDAAYRFVRGISRYYTQRLNDPKRSGSIPNVTKRIIPVFTADYALYWFDYLAGYDVVLAELGWNQSRLRHIAQCRGAAKVQKKDWGVVITWTYTHPPYLASGSAIFKDMLTAYWAGAKYVVVLDFPYGTLSEEHFAAMKNFWSYVRDYPKKGLGKVEGQVAFVLPKDYGWGMRNPKDKIWGLWPPDSLSPQIWSNVNMLISKYGLKLDIIYDDPRFNFTEKYSKIYFWNNTIG